MSFGINMNSAISAVDARLQAELYEKFNEAETRNEQLKTITTFLQHVHKHQKDGKLDISKEPAVQHLLKKVREASPHLLDKEVHQWNSDELEMFKANLNHEIKKMESSQKMVMDMAIYRMGEHKNIYEALLETCKRLSQMGDNHVRNQRQ